MKQIPRPVAILAVASVADILRKRQARTPHWEDQADLVSVQIGLGALVGIAPHNLTQAESDMHVTFLVLAKAAEDVSKTEGAPPQTRQDKAVKAAALAQAAEWLAGRPEAHGAFTSRTTITPTKRRNRAAPDDMEMHRRMRRQRRRARRAANRAAEHEAERESARLEADVTSGVPV